MRRTSLAAATVLLAGTAFGQVTLQPIATDYAGTDVSADGTVVVGNSTTDGLYETFRWTQTTGVIRLGRSSVAALGRGAGTPDVSYDGTKVSATIVDATGTFVTVGLWEDGVGWTDCVPPLLPDSVLLDEAYGSAWGLSGDGSTVAGLYWRQGSDPNQFGDSAHVLNWTAGGGPVSLSFDGEYDSRGNALNYDGTVTVGWEAEPDGLWQPHAWRNGVDHKLSTADAFCEAYGINGDGDVIVGQTAVGPPANPSPVAALWTWNGASYDETVLGSLPGTPIGLTGMVWADAVSDDGTIVVGTNDFVYAGPFSDGTGFIWTARTGMFDVVDYMAENGITLPAGTQVAGLTAISGDGGTIVMLLQDTTTFIISTALLHIPVACSAADMTTQGAAAGSTNFGMPDGLVSAADIQYYVNLFTAGDLNADLTTLGAGSGDPGFGVPDGLVTAADIQYYVNLYVAGCP